MDYEEALKRLHDFPDKLRKNYDGLISDIQNMPQTMHDAIMSPTDGLVSDGMRQRVTQTFANPPAPNPDMWIDSGLRITTIAPIWKTVEATDPQSLANLLKNYGTKK